MRIWEKLFNRKCKGRPTAPSFAPKLESLEQRDVPTFLPFIPPAPLPVPGFGATFATSITPFGTFGSPGIAIPPTTSVALSTSPLLVLPTSPLVVTPLPPPFPIVPLTTSGLFPLVSPAVTPFVGLAGNAGLSGLVNSLFVSLLQRPVDPTGLAANVASLRAGTSLTTVVQQIATSQEARGLQVTRFYTAILGRAPDDAGFASNVQLFQTFGERAVLTSFLTSSEFLTLNRTNDAFVVSLYQSLLLRTPSVAEVNNWTGVFDTGVGMPGVVNGILVSAEFNTLGLNSAFQGFLNRLPDPTGTQVFLPRLQSGLFDSTSLAVSIITSSEFQGRFGI